MYLCTNLCALCPHTFQDNLADNQDDDDDNHDNISNDNEKEEEDLKKKDHIYDLDEEDDHVLLTIKMMKYDNPLNYFSFSGFGPESSKTATSERGRLPVLPALLSNLELDFRTASKHGLFERWTILCDRRRWQTCGPRIHVRTIVWQCTISGI